MSYDLSAHERLAHALETALERYATVMAQPFPAKASLTILDTDVFVALAQPDGDGVMITASTGVVRVTATLWERAIWLSDELPVENRLNIAAAETDAVIDASLAWLMLHELHHHYIGHLTLVGVTGIAETNLPPTLGLTRRAELPPSPLKDLDRIHELAIRRCLELQADHDALEILLGHYAPERWDTIRYYTAAAMAMMVLIDQQDQADDLDRTHPLSATRIFQLFGALALLWMPGPGSDWEAPDNNEIEAYHHAVVASAVSDAMILAEAGHTPPVVRSLEEADQLFDDIRKLQQPEISDRGELKTPGAQEYAQLLPFNDEAIRRLGPEMFSR